MEFFGGDHDDNNEQCESSESGWTMYLESPQNDNANHQQILQSDFDDSEYGTNDNDKKKNMKKKKKKKKNNKALTYENDSDDSMTSDASSRPKRAERRRFRRREETDTVAKSTSNRDGEGNEETGKGKYCSENKGKKKQRAEK